MAHRRRHPLRDWEARSVDLIACARERCEMIPDRHFLVKPGHRVKTDYVPVFRCRLACRERMAVGDVGSAYQKLLQYGNESMWPCPRGHWEGDDFVIEDGRHEWIASVMLGKDYILVAWIEECP